MAHNENESDNRTKEHGATSNLELRQEATVERRNFIQQIIDADIENGKYQRADIITRFPPEPNGYLHIGHAKSICLNFGLAQEFGGKCNLRFDDTNPSKEEMEYVESIEEDVRWLDVGWTAENALFASDYFGKMYEYAVTLVKAGKAYVCDLDGEETRKLRGTLTTPGENSPYRDRSVEENLDLLERMKNGEFENGSRTLRAKIDMASPNMNMRDPVMYRILNEAHHRTGDTWCIYPMYDWAHGLEDSVEGITHSICTLEFEHHRPLYDWFLDQLQEHHAEPVHHPQQIEFARLNLTYTVMSKRKLLELVRDKHVSGWNDPRMPTISGLRRRGYTPKSIREFCREIGVAKFNSTIDVVKLENAVREDLNKTAERRMAVLKPLKVVITNFPEGQVDELEAVNNPEDPEAGTRIVPFTRELYIEQDDFMEDAPKKFFRLAPGREVRLRYAYFVTCTDVIKNDAGEIVEVHCTYDPETRGGSAPDGRKVKGTLHWVSAEKAIDAEVRLYDRLFTVESPDSAKDERDYKEYLNPESLEVLSHCKLEPALGETLYCDVNTIRCYQFERLGYFCVDYADSAADAPVFNRTVSLRDSWAKVAKQQPKKGGGQQKKKPKKDHGHKKP